MVKLFLTWENPTPSRMSILTRGGDLIWTMFLRLCLVYKRDREERDRKERRWVERNRWEIEWILRIVWYDKDGREREEKEWGGGERKN
jgi:hypothetical protein